MGSHDDELRQLESKVSVLEKQVTFLLKVNGFHLSEMRKISDEALLRLYQDSVHVISVIRKGVALEIVEHWAEIFLQLSEVEMVRLQPIVGFDHTWEPFYVLCIKLMTQVRTCAEIKTSTRVQQLFSLLEKGRQGLQACGVMMCRKFQDTLTDTGRALIKDGDLMAFLPA
jgi:hypothetical protein